MILACNHHEFSHSAVQISPNQPSPARAGEAIFVFWAEGDFVRHLRINPTRFCGNVMGNAPQCYEQR
eukprot:g76938.t1